MLKCESMPKYHSQFGAKYELSYPSKPTKTLMSNQFDRERYAGHCRNLRFCLEHSLKLKTIDRVPKFHQPRYLAP